MCCLSVVFFREKGIAESRAVFLETNFEERRYEQSTAEFECIMYGRY